MTETIQTAPPSDGVDLTVCDQEPIHIPGLIQPYGMLFGLTGPDLTIAAVTANIAHHLTVQPDQALGQSLSAFISQDSFTAIQAAISRQEDPPALLHLHIPNTSETWQALLHPTSNGALLEVILSPAVSPFDAADLFHRYDKATRKLRSATDLTTVSQRLAEEIRNLTGFDRVKIYRFSPDWNGEVIAESNSGRLPSYLGLHFPASDIPAQARELYRRNLERLIPDVAYTPIPIIQANATAIDLSDVSLRSVSPIHLEYLRNMQVAASMSVSIMRDGKLWGLVACHHGEPRFLTPELRQASVLLAQLAAWQLTLVEESAILRVNAQVKVIETQLLQEATAGHDYRECLLRHGSELLDLMNATGLVLSNGINLTTLGATPAEPELRELLAWLALQGPEIFVTNNLPALYPPAMALPEAAGVLAVPLGGATDNIMVWFRPEIARTVTWGGDPNKAVLPADRQLNPRLSFAAWSEIVHGQSRPWEHHETASAQSLRDMITDIILRRSLELEAMNVRLIRSNEELEAFAYVASHDLKEPLRQIETFATLLERAFNNRESPGVDPKRWFQGIQASSRRLRGLIDDLAEYSRLGRHANPFAPCDLNVVIDEVRADLGIQIDLTQANLSCAKLPVVMCDHTQMRQVMQNLISNAMKYRHPDRPPEIRIGSNIYPGRGGTDPARFPLMELTVTDNGLGFDEKYRERIFEPFQRLHSADDYEGSGIGLAICRKIIDRHGGTISATSSPGLGSVFVIQLPIRPLPSGA